MNADLFKRVEKIEEHAKANKESDIEKEMKLCAEVFRRKSDLSDAEIAARERSRAEHEDDDPAMKNYLEAFKKDTEEEAKQKVEIERLRAEHEAEEARKQAEEERKRAEIEAERAEYNKMLLKGPPDARLTRKPFGKELVKDDKGNLFWRTVLHLEDCEIGPAVDPMFQEALESC